MNGSQVLFRCLSVGECAGKASGLQFLLVLAASLDCFPAGSRFLNTFGSGFGVFPCFAAGSSKAMPLEEAAPEEALWPAASHDGGVAMSRDLGARASTQSQCRKGSQIAAALSVQAQRTAPQKPRNQTWCEGAAPSRERHIRREGRVRMLQQRAAQCPSLPTGEPSAFEARRTG